MSWNTQHDRFIALLDVQDYHSPAIVNRVKKQYPELRHECITPGMIDKRLRILDETIDCLFFTEGLERVKLGCGDLDLGSESEADVPKPSTPRANIKKVTIGAPQNGNHGRRVSTGGASAKITINRNGSTVHSSPLHGMNSPPKVKDGEPIELKEMPLKGKGKEKEHEKPNDKLALWKSKKIDGGKKIVEANEEEEKEEEEPFGVPSVMRTSSGRPVLR
jgi:hypothetical protein